MDHNNIVDNHRPFLDRADAKDGNLRLMNDRGAEQAAESAVVRDCECPSLDLLGIQILGPGPLSQVCHFFGELQESLSIRVSHHRHQEPIVQRCGDTNMNVFLDDDTLIAPRRVHDRHLSNSMGHSTDHEGQIGQASAFSEFGDAREVRFKEGRDMG